MSVECVRIIVRLMALATVVVGLAMTTMAIVGLVAWSQAQVSVAGQSWSGSGMEVSTIVAPASVIAWGVGLGLASSRLADFIVK